MAAAAAAALAALRRLDPKPEPASGCGDARSLQARGSEAEASQQRGPGGTARRPGGEGGGVGGSRGAERPAEVRPRGLCPSRHRLVRKPEPERLRRGGRRPVDGCRRGVAAALWRCGLTSGPHCGPDPGFEWVGGKGRWRGRHRAPKCADRSPLGGPQRPQAGCDHGAGRRQCRSDSLLPRRGDGGGTRQGHHIRPRLTVAETPRPPPPPRMLPAAAARRAPGPGRAG